MADINNASGYFKRLQRWWRGELVEQDLAEQASVLAEWFASPCGELLLESEKNMLAELLPSLFGYHLLQISAAIDADLASQSPIHHRVVVAGRASAITANPRIGLVSCCDSLPFENDSLDVVILHHVLDFSINPHQVLKEINRVLIPRGHVIIVGFNPFSLFGLWKAVASLLTRSPQWRYNGIAQKRLFDWFKLLDLEKSTVRHAFYRPPCRSAALLKRLAFLENAGQRLGVPLGGVYLVVARKDVCAVTPIRAPWEKHNRRMMGLAAARPSTSRIQKKDVLH